MSLGLRSAFLLSVVSAWLAGCRGSYAHGPVALEGSVSSYQTWKLTGQLLKDVSLAADGATATASVTMHNSYEGAELTIDLGRPCVFNHVAVEHGPDEFGFARQVALLTSSDGRNFQEQRRVAGQRKVTNILLVKAALARYIRLRVAVPGNRPWSVAEVVLH